MDIKYGAMIFLPSQEETPVAEVNQRLAACLRAEKPDRIGLNEASCVAVTTDDIWTGYWGVWSLSLSLSTEPHIIEEAQEMAQDKQHFPQWDVIGRCKRRVELWTDPDPQMGYFNTYVCVLERVEQQFEDAIMWNADGERL